MYGVQRRMISVDNFFVFLRLLFLCFVVAICDLVHDEKTIFNLSYVLRASGNLLLQIAVSRASLIFQKRFPDAVNTKGRPYVASTACNMPHIATTKQKIIISQNTKNLSTEIIQRCTPCFESAIDLVFQRSQ